MDEAVDGKVLRDLAQRVDDLEGRSEDLREERKALKERADEAGINFKALVEAAKERRKGDEEGERHREDVSAYLEALKA